VPTTWAADVISGLGIALWLVGAGYWVWFAMPGGRIAKIRDRTPRRYLGCLSVLGLLVFVLGRMLAGDR
jgi:hypothetical protein